MRSADEHQEIGALPTNRGVVATAREIDQRAVTAARNYMASRWPAALAAARLEGRLSFHRLGYRTQADYANEELGTSARSLRRMACLGRRLAALPEICAAFSSGALPLTKAETIARVATAGSERRWLALANELTGRQLSQWVREHLRRDGDSTDAAAPDADEPRTEWRAEVPGWMIGKADSVLRLVNKVAGSPLPQGHSMGVHRRRVSLRCPERRGGVSLRRPGGGGELRGGVRGGSRQCEETTVPRLRSRGRRISAGGIPGRAAIS